MNSIVDWAFPVFVGGIALALALLVMSGVFV
jgi:hypothetical protein